jgi:ankyrin repeat protein
MASGSEQFQDDHGGAASVGQHATQLKLADGLEGRMISTRDYRQNVARDNARVHNGDQHHHYYARAGDGPSTKTIPKDPMQQLLESLSFPQKDYRFTTIEPAYQRTCQWLFETPEYTRWRDQDLQQLHHGILWLKGKPGAGKSTIIKHALEHAKLMYPDERNVCFFFNARGDKLEKCTEGMYRSLLHQIAQGVPSLLQFIHPEAVKGYTSTGWPLGLLRSLFREAALKLASSTKLNCYVDALDEGEDEDQIRDMVAFFEELSEAAVSKDIRLSIYFASRHYPHISVGRCEEIILDHYKGHHDDIASYIRQRLRCSHPALKEELVTEIIDRSSGVFLWVVLVIRILNTESDRGNQHRLRTSLQAIPKGLNDLFDSIIGSGDTDGALLPALLWVLFAKRSLDPIEMFLAVVYCTNPDSLSSFVWDYATVDERSLRNFIVSSSKGLLEVVAPRYVFWDQEFQVLENELHLSVQFIHESVREYLLETGLLRLDPTLTGNLVGISNLRLAQWCQSYIELSFRHVVPRMDKAHVDDPLLLLQGLIRAAPFSRYAIAGILHHSEEATSHQTDVSIPFEDCLHAHLPLFVAFTRSSTTEAHQTVLHVLARAGYPSLILKLLRRYDHTARQHYMNLVIRGGFEEQSAALHLATNNRNFNVVQILLENGADVNTVDGRGRTILMYAATAGLTGMIQPLLVYGADADARDESGRTALHRLVATGDLKAIEILVRHGADVSARNNTGYTPLMYAAFGAKPDAVKALLTNAPEVNTKDKGGRAALDHAMFPLTYFSIAIRDVLLQHGADTNIRVDNFEPLLTAVVRSQDYSVADVQVFLRYGANVNAIDDFGSTALHAAVERLDMQIVDTILQHDADVNARDGQGKTPLMLAVSQGPITSTEVVETLLENGADVDAVNRSGTTALREAVKCGLHLEVIKMLLDYGADVYSQEEGQRSILDIAHGNSNESITSLLNYFADVPPRSRFEAARALENEEWWREYVRHEDGYMSPCCSESEDEVQSN